jgi:DNA excision repair protein ERCC-2
LAAVVRIDIETRTINVGVRELAYGGERRVRGALAQLRTDLGRRVHERYARERAEEEPSLKSEYAVALDVEHRHWTVALRGRADGVIDDEHTLVVEEVKSVMGSVERADGDRVHARLQARLYALCIDEAQDKPVEARLVLISLEDGARSTLDAGYQRDETRSVLMQLVDELVNDVERRIARSEERAAIADRLVFPYAEQRAFQGELIDTIEAGLAQGRAVLANAPTGIGKTVNAMLPALRFALHNDAKLLYLTSKTTQRTHVARTFLDIAPPDEPLTALTLRRRDQMCPPGDLRCHPDVCPLLLDFDARCGDVVDGLLAEGQHVSPERIFERGAEMKLCPYELSLEIAAHADVIIGDYNHVFDVAIPDAIVDASRRRVVVVDEAHNLFDRARAYDSPFVGARLLGVVERALDDEPLDHALRDLVNKTHRAIDRTLDAATPDDAEATFDGCVECELGNAGVHALASEAGLLALRWSFRCWQRRELTRDDPILELAGKLLQLSELERRDGPELVSYVASDDAPLGRGLGVVCVDPARRLQAVHREALGTIAMSATLSPLDYFSEVLGFSRLDPILTSAPSPFPRENREVVVVPSVATTYAERDDHVPAIAALIERIIAVRPGSYIAFFPSYAFLARVRAMLNIPAGELLEQIPGASPSLRAHLLKQLKSGPRRLMLAVMGGIFGEGIDLPGDDLIGAIVVGPGLPALSFERLAMRRHYDQVNDAGFAYAMVYPGLQRVIQAAGRVIRSERDRGVIALLGRRFAHTEYGACLPPDWYRYAPDELVCDDPVEALTAFWQG